MDTDTDTHIHMHAHTHTQTHTRTPILPHTCTHTPTHTHSYPYQHTHPPTHTHTHIETHLHTVMHHHHYVGSCSHYIHSAPCCSDVPCLDREWSSCTHHIYTLHGLSTPLCHCCNTKQITNMFQYASQTAASLCFQNKPKQQNLTRELISTCMTWDAYSNSDVAYV